MSEKPQGTTFDSTRTKQHPPPPRNLGGRPRLGVVAPKRKLTLAEAMDVAAQALGAQMLGLKEQAERRALTLSERDWMLAIHDRLERWEGQRMRMVMMALTSDKVTQAERAAIIEAFAGVRKTLPAVEAPKP